MRNGIVVCALLAVAVGAIAGCGSTGEGETAAAGVGVRRATAWLNPTEGNSGGGSAIFIREGDQITVQVTLEQLPPGVHALHIHENGDCSAGDGTSAGGHWNPTGQDHGKWGEAPYHLGDVGNVTVGEDGTGSLTLGTDLWTMGGGADTDVLGKSVILHAGPDDFTTQPTGGAGARLACGVIKTK
jgi:Cu-Zn family superoxide dismutase